MADFDIVADSTPQLPFRPTRNYGRKTVTQLRTEIQAIDASTYTNAEVLKMTYNDLTYAIHALS